MDLSCFFGRNPVSTGQACSGDYETPSSCCQHGPGRGERPSLRSPDLAEETPPRRYSTHHRPGTGGSERRTTGFRPYPEERHDPGSPIPVTLPLSGDDETRRAKTADKAPKGQTHDRTRVVTAERCPERRPRPLGTKGSGATQGTVERHVAADLSLAETTQADPRAVVEPARSTSQPTSMRPFR